jgi:iron complex outermembrane receptor protein
MYRYNPSFTNQVFIYENVDAKMYGWDISVAYVATHELTFEAAIAQTFGKKESKMAYQNVTLNDKDLRNIPPLKARIAAKYEMGRFSS